MIAQVLANGGHLGFDTYKEYLWLKNEGVKYAPDLIMVVFFFNDATRMPVDTVIKQTYTESVARSQSRSRLYKFLKYRYLRKIVSERTLEAYQAPYFMGERGFFDHCKDSILKIKQLAEENKAELLFVIFPMLIDLDDDYTFQNVHDLVSNFLKENDIRTHSLLPAFLDYEGSDDSLWINLLDSHPNEKGNAIAADALYQYFINSDLLN